MSEVVAEAEKNVEFIMKDEMMSVHCGSKIGWSSTNQAFLSFPEHWRAFSMKFRWRNGWRNGLGKTQSGATFQSSLQERLSWLLRALSANSLQLSALSRYFLYCRTPTPPRVLLPGVDGIQGLIVGWLLMPSMCPPALKSPLCPKAPRRGWSGVACWVCITAWFLPLPASTVLIPNQYPAC